MFSLKTLVQEPISAPELPPELLKQAEEFKNHIFDSIGKPIGEKTSK